MAITIKDVAVEAGVSIATVSHVLNGTRVVMPETSKKVLSAMDRLGYSPNALARGLKQKKTNVVGLIVPDISNFFFTAIASSIESELRKHGYDLVLCNSNENLDFEISQILNLNSYFAQGIIIAPTTYDFDYRHLLPSRDYPVVFFDRRLKVQQGDSVTVDSRSVTKEAVLHLLAKGHRNIAFIGASDSISTTVDRLGGYKDALEEYGIKADRSIIKNGEPTTEVGKELCNELLENRAAHGFTAMIVASSLMSIGAMKCLIGQGIEIPSDIAFIGFDDYCWTELIRPLLSTVIQPTAEIGEKAVELLLSRMNGSSDDFRSIELKASFINRESS